MRRSLLHASAAVGASGQSRAIKKLHAVPASMQPFELSPSYTPFPLPTYDPQTGFQPLKFDGVPDVNAAAARLQEAESKSPSTSSVNLTSEEWAPQAQREAFSRYDTTWLRRPTASMDGEEDDGMTSASTDALLSSLPHSAAPTTHGTPLTGTNALSNFAAAAVSERHLQYAPDQSHPQLQLLNCMRTLDDVLAQYRTTTQERQSHIHVAALSDLTASVATMPQAALVEALTAIRQTLPGGRGALYFPVFSDVRKRNYHSVNTDFVKLHAYLDFFTAVQDRVTGFDTEARMPRILSEPAVFTNAIASAAHVQLFDRKGTLAPVTFDTGRDNLGPLNLKRVRLEKWPGDRIIDALEDAVELYGDQCFAAYTFEQVTGLLTSLIALCSSPGVALPSGPARKLLQTILQRAAQDPTLLNDASHSAALSDVFLALTAANVFSAELKNLVLKCAYPTCSALTAMTRFKPRVLISEAERVYELSAATESPIDRAAAFLGYLKGASGLRHDMTTAAIAAAKKHRLTEVILSELAATHPWLNADERAARQELELDGGRADQESSRLSESLLGYFGSREDGTVHGDALPELERLRATLPSPGAPFTETLQVGPHIRRFAQVMLEAPRDRYVEALFYHSDAAQRGPWAVTSLVDRAINGRSLAVVALSTLLKLYDVERTATEEFDRVRARAVLQLLLFELQAGRAYLVSAVDELQLQGTKGTATESSIIIDIASRALERLVTILPTFVLGINENPIKAFQDHEMVMESKRSDGNGTRGDNQTALHRTREHFLAHLEDIARFIGGSTCIETSQAAVVTDRASRYHDFRFSSKRRNDLWSMQDATSSFDRKYRPVGRRHVLQGVARNAAGSDMKYIGVYAPGNNH